MYSECDKFTIRLSSDWTELFDRSLFLLYKLDFSWPTDIFQMQSH